ncbi:MAG: fibrobacter succinogenes major paralogous domain-containing protein [Bacteroidetes bacterium]|nr:fibrobacter succinogenes major paralogous domain-containing protein [Bacteroidota bacterium]
MKRKSFALSIVIIAIAISTSAQITGTFTDTRDGKVYKTVKIGTQTWMAENLAYKEDSGCWAYDNKPENIGSYGYLYTWLAAKKACPAGWHLATKEEWSALSTYLGGESTAAEKLKEAGTLHWQKPVSDATNESGFTCLPGGFRNNTGEFYNLGLMCFYWCSTEEDSEKAIQVMIFSHTKHVTISYIEKTNGFSARCIKD